MKVNKRLEAVLVWGIPSMFLAIMVLGFFRLPAGTLNYDPVIIPKAFYYGLSWLWEDPKWMARWDDNTANLAFVVLGSPETVDDKMKSSQEINRLNSWVKRLPEKELGELRRKTTLLCDVWTDYETSLFSSVVEGRDYPPSPSHPDLSSLKSFRAVLEQEASAAESRLKVELQGSSPTTEEDRKRIQEKIKPALEFLSSERKRRLSQIFDEK